MKTCGGTGNQVVGILGGGQLGRMLALAARRMAVRTVVWTGGGEAPAAEVADLVVDLPFDDHAGLARFCETVTVATVEFENIPAETLRAVAEQVPLHPSPQAVAICQNRATEKEFLRETGIPCTRFAVVNDADELASAMQRFPGPWVLKTADSGYDGRGQLRVSLDADPWSVWKTFSAPRGVLEQWVSFRMEISVMVARGAGGETATYDPAENHHRDHILDWSVVPARVSEEAAARARAIAVRLAEALDYRGVMGVEFFVTDDGGLLVNEIAPRPHNSGHHTLDACVTSQFEQQLRAVLGLPLGSTRLLSPVAMLNLLGDLWPGGAQPPDWRPLFADGAACLHLYGKTAASGRRKMGHANFLGATAEDALARACRAKERWLREAHGSPVPDRSPRPAIYQYPAIPPLRLQS